MANNQTIGGANYVLKTTSADLDAGLAKAGSSIKKATTSWNVQFKNILAGTAIGGALGQVIGKIGAGVFDKLGKALEDGLERLGTALNKILGIRKKISEEEQLNQRIADLDRQSKALDKQQAAQQTIRDTLKGINDETALIGKSDYFKRWFAFNEMLKKMNLPKSVKEAWSDKAWDALKKQKEAMEAAAAKAEAWKEANKGAADAIKNQFDRMKEALDLNQEFATSQEKLARGMERLKKLRDTGMLNKGVFVRAAAQLRDEVLGPQRLIAPAHGTGSREAAEQLLQQKFGGFKDPAAAAALKEQQKGNALAEAGNAILGQVKQALEKLKPIEFREFRP